MSPHELAILHDAEQSASRVLSEGHERETPRQEIFTMNTPRLTSEIFLNALTQTDVIANEPLGSSARALAASVRRPCQHKFMRLVERIRGEFDDHETTYLVCKCGQAGAVETAFFADRRFELRAMTPTELTRYTTL